MSYRTVIFLCGLIGSGKTTYATRNFSPFTDLDHLHSFAKKTDQINWTLRLLKREYAVCHITSMPTDEELNAFKNYNKRYLWMNTSLNKAKANILVRDRKRDTDNLEGVYSANVEYANQFKETSLPFEIIHNYGR